jgi:2-dehydropantoate 2-reductase
MTRVCILGAGVIGSLYAGHLAEVADVWVLTRREEHARDLNEHGLRVTGRNDRHAVMRATSDPAALPEINLCIVATKATHLEQAAAVLEGHLATATVMTVQNGLGAEEIVRAHGDWPLLSAVTFMSGTKHADTHVEYILDTETWIGPHSGTAKEDADAAAALLVSSGLKARAFDDLRPAQWSKLIFNATVNSVAALTHLPHDFHFAEFERAFDLGRLVKGLMEEGKAVAAAAGIALHDDPWKMNVHAAQRGSAHYPSMLEDVDARRPTEIDLITGSLVREAGRLSVAVPLHEAMYALVKGVEAAW